MVVLSLMDARGPEEYDPHYLDVLARVEGKAPCLMVMEDRQELARAGHRTSIARDR